MTVAPFSLRSAALKPSDIAERLGVETSTVYRWMRSGELPSIDLVGTMYVLVPAFERFLERRSGVMTIEQQVSRDIGPGFEEEHEAAADVLEGLGLPIADAPATRQLITLGVAPAFDDVRTELRRQLDEFEARYGIESEHVHRLLFAEHQVHVEGVPDDIVPQWASAYAAYLDLSLVRAR